MITIDCEKISPMKHPLLTYVADSLMVVPILKSEKIILTTIRDDQTIYMPDVIRATEKFLKSIKQGKNFRIIQEKDSIRIESLDGSTLEEEPKAGKKPFLECTHCGFMTQYEEDLRNHRLIHYI